MTILKELVVVAGTYEVNGEEKKRWKTIGHVHASKDGREYITLDPMMNLAAIPRKDGDDRVYVSMFEPKPKDGQKPQRQARAASSEDVPFDDDIGF